MSSTRPQIALWKRLLLGLVIVLGIVVCGVGYNLYRLVTVKIPESYAAWTTGNLIVEYLATHTNQWPRSWDDLRAATNSLLEKGRPVYTPLDRLPRFVKVDWHAATDHLLQAARSNSNARLQLITRVDGSPLRTVWGPDTEPNTKVMGYLRWSLTSSNGGSSQ
jgi:hypothetical protein